MAINKNDKGLTLIELLITIAVIAIVAAISVPVITNVIADSRTNSASAMQEQAQAFIDKYESSGDWSFDSASQTFLGGIDEDGNGTVALGSVASPGAEVIDTLAVDAGQFTATVAGTTATVTAAGGSNNAGGNNGAFLSGSLIDSLPSGQGLWLVNVASSGGGMGPASGQFRIVTTAEEAMFSGLSAAANNNGLVGKTITFSDISGGFVSGGSADVEGRSFVITSSSYNYGFNMGSMSNAYSTIINWTYTGNQFETMSVNGTWTITN